MSQVSFAKEPYKRDDILQKRQMILRSLLIVATPYEYSTHQEKLTVCHRLCDALCYTVCA